jgi:hypothetical protein
MMVRSPNSWVKWEKNAIYLVDLTQPSFFSSYVAKKQTITQWRVISEQQRYGRTAKYPVFTACTSSPVQLIDKLQVFSCSICAGIYHLVFF